MYDLQLSVNAYSDKLVMYTVAAVSLNGTGSVAPPAGLSFGVADGPGSMRARNKITAMQIRYECMKFLHMVRVTSVCLFISRITQGCRWIFVHFGK